MPIYEYRCGSCSNEVEALQKVSDSPLRKCPKCGKLTMRRLMSAPAFRLKRNLVETSSSESSDSSSKAADSAKSDASAKTEGAAKETKKPAEKPASEVKKPRKTRAAAGPTRT